MDDPQLYTADVLLIAHVKSKVLRLKFVTYDVNV